MLHEHPVVLLSLAIAEERNVLPHRLHVPSKAKVFFVYPVQFACWVSLLTFSWLKHPGWLHMEEINFPRH